MTNTDTAVATVDENSALIEQVVMVGDLKALTPAQRIAYYRTVCESVGLNPLTKPFEYIVLNGKLTLYARKDATDQLRSIRGISITAIETAVIDGIFTATAHGRDRNGREDIDIGAVDISRLKGLEAANAMKKAITQAKRRLTLSLAGLGWLDESETLDVPSARPANVDVDTGEILPEVTVLPKTLREVAAAAQEAAEAPQEAPMDADTVPLFDEAPSGSQEPTGLSEKEFAGLVKTTGIERTVVASTAKRIFPKAANSAELTDNERETLWDVLAIEAAEKAEA